MDTIIDPQLVTDMIQKRAWLPLGALAVGAGVRLLKYDVKFFPNIPSRYRVWAAFALGQVAGTLEAVIAGKTYKEAIVWGLTQSVIAIIGQNTIIDSLRGGKEIPVPGLTNPGSVGVDSLRDGKEIAVPGLTKTPVPDKALSQDTPDPPKTEPDPPKVESDN